MKRMALVVAAVGALGVAACMDQRTAETPPSPALLTSSAIGYYCGMNLLEHSGPKGQIILASRSEPIFFSSARDTLSFTILPEEPKDIRAIYVSDMGKAPSWDLPGADNWVDARQASFVIGSRVKGGMGGDEAVPFSERSAAERFAMENGGRVVGFADVPKEFVLGAGAEAASAVDDGHGAPIGHSGHAAPAAAASSHAHGGNAR